MMYKIKSEYIDLWGAEANENTILTENDLEAIARGWEKTPADVMDQLVSYSWESIVNLMDDEIREAVHADLAPCSDAEFLEEYKKRHFEKYGKEFVVN